MFVAYVIVAVLVSALLAFSARALLVKEESVTAGLTGLGVPLSWFPALAALKFAGALGLLAGMAYRPLGIAASVGVVLYFAGAVITHVRAKDFKGLPIPTVLVAVAVVPLVLGVASV